MCRMFIILRQHSKLLFPVTLGLEIKKCAVPVDILFLLHASQDVEQENFERMKYLVNLIISKFKVNSLWTRIGIIVFSNSAKVVVPLGNITDPESLSHTLKSVSVGGMGSNMFQALQIADTDLFNPGTARDMAKVVVLLTSNKQNPQSSPAGLAAEKLSSKGVTVFAVGAGPKVEKQELETLVKSESDLFISRDFTELVPRVAQIVPRLCRATGK